ncbi:DNA alkylation repair protein [Actinomadura terrae]|uniref:DNA alkylation repair protein n=1 Tax=Actinomadura terrae TaxID=604353 RepID=UPI001FA815C7|nr:DNA alkylation repair protein [Actinomadura terrae]
MTSDVTAEQYVRKVEEHCSAEQLELLRRHFWAGDPAGENPGGGDIDLGVGMGKILTTARPFTAMPLDDVERLLASPMPELRAGALRVMGNKAKHKKATDDERAVLYALYMKYKHKINSWGLVDISSHQIVGLYLLDRPRDVLYEMAASDNWWEHRIALVSTLAFVGRGDLDDTFRLAELLRDDEHDKVHTALGWLLREAGRHDRARLMKFLDAHAATLPRITLRTAIEHFDKEQRTYYLGMKKRLAEGG